MRTRSDAARQRSLLKLPEDCLRNVALFIDCDVDAARLALTSRRVMRSLTSTVWAKILKATHGGLNIAAAETDGRQVAARLAAARADRGPVDGFWALATNCGAAPYAQQQYWADALFRREPWRIYCSRTNPGGEPVLCAAVFLAGGEDERQMGRWNGVCGEKGRWKQNLIAKCLRDGKSHDDASVSPVVRQTLLHWAYELSAADFSTGAKRVKSHGAAYVPTTQLAGVVTGARIVGGFVLRRSVGA